MKEHLNGQNLIYLVVGDAATQLERVKALGYGEPVLLDRWGQAI